MACRPKMSAETPETYGKSEPMLHEMANSSPYVKALAPILVELAMRE
ncbi:MAG: hypothetical protein OEY99_02805 [Aigarchaeota archaeon]|nr:hypothetical protein [Aigarchaeota archaeon]